MDNNFNIIIPRPIACLKYVKILKKEKDPTTYVITRSAISKKNKIKVQNIVFIQEELIGKNIQKNAIFCLSCNSAIESRYTYHTVWCKCGRCKISGGFEKLIRKCSSKYIEL